MERSTGAAKIKIYLLTALIAVRGKKMTSMLGIRREDKNEWEARVPLVPEHVSQLVRDGYEVIVQPSTIRTFSDAEFEAAGAVIQEDLSGCKFVFGVKEFPASIFREGQAYLFFSHTIKGQKYNMPMLQKILDRNCTLLDYEKITDENNRRHVFFGNYAGLAGMLETLFTLGKRLESEGVITPLLDLKRPLEYHGLAEAKDALGEVAKRVESEGLGLPGNFGPLLIGFAGYGNVSKGAQEILDILPHEEISPGDLSAFIENGQYSERKVYKVVFYEKDMVVPVDPAREFELFDYFDHPERYRGVFEKYLPHLSALVNCIYWTPDYPRLVTKDWLRENWTSESRLKVIGDISCDIEGSVECTLEGTTPGNPIYVYDVATGEKIYGHVGNGPVIMSVDTLPSELPRDSSTFFGNQLMPFVKELADADYSVDFEDLALRPDLKRAVIAHRGHLTPGFQYLSEFLQ